MLMLCERMITVLITSTHHWSKLSGQHCTLALSNTTTCCFHNLQISHCRVLTCLQNHNTIYLYIWPWPCKLGQLLWNLVSLLCDTCSRSTMSISHQWLFLISVLSQTRLQAEPARYCVNFEYDKHRLNLRYLAVSFASEWLVVDFIWTLKSDTSHFPVFT